MGNQLPFNKTSQWLGIFLVTAFMLGGFMTPSAVAAKDRANEKDKNFVVGRWAYYRLNQAHQAIQKKQYAEALKTLEALQNRRGLNDYERALMWQTYGYVWTSKEKPKKAIKAFEKCLELKSMPESAALDLEFNLGQLYLATQQYKHGAKTLRSWYDKVKNPSASSIYLLSMAYMQTKDPKKALFFIKKAIEKTKKPQESWLQYMLSLQYQLGQKWEVVSVLKELINRFPKKTYWLQLAAIYSELKKEKETLAVFELAYRQKYLTKESEFYNLASLYVQQGIPIKAAKVLEKALKNGKMKNNVKNLRMLAESYLSAREYKRALEPLARAAKLDDKGDLFVQMGQVYLKMEQYGKAIAAFRQGIKKGKLTDPGTTLLLEGMAYFNLGKYSAAQKAFQQASGHPKTKLSAEQWIKMARAKME